MLAMKRRISQGICRRLFVAYGIDRVTQSVVVDSVVSSNRVASGGLAVSGTLRTFCLSVLGRKHLRYSTLFRG